MVARSRIDQEALMPATTHHRHPPPPRQATAEELRVSYTALAKAAIAVMFFADVLIALFILFSRL